MKKKKNKEESTARNQRQENGKRKWWKNVDHKIKWIHKNKSKRLEIENQNPWWTDTYYFSNNQ